MGPGEFSFAGSIGLADGLPPFSAATIVARAVEVLTPALATTYRSYSDF